MICKNCGGDISAGLNFCPDCGSKVAEMFPEEVKANTANVDVEPVIEETAFPEPAEAKVSAPEVAATAAATAPAAVQPTYQQPRPQAKPYDPSAEAGKSKAIGALICGIIGLVLCCTFYFSGIALILAIVGLILAGSAKKKGYNGGVRKAGFGTSLGALIVSIIEIVILVAVIGILAPVMSDTIKKAERQARIEKGNITSEDIEEAIDALETADADDFDF